MSDILKPKINHKLCLARKDMLDNLFIQCPNSKINNHYCEIHDSFNLRIDQPIPIEYVEDRLKSFITSESKDKKQASTEIKEKKQHQKKPSILNQQNTNIKEKKQLEQKKYHEMMAKFRGKTNII